jgi:hypothetical protein
MEPWPKSGDREGMNRIRAVSLLLVLSLLVATPCAALHARYLDIAIDRDGNATVTFEYTLPMVEQVLAFLGAVNPERDLGQILAATTGGRVERLPSVDGAASYSVEGFANITETPPQIIYDTHDLNLSWGEAGYKSSILAPLIEPDFSPEVTVIRFPDAYSVTFRDLLHIPNVTHSF